MQKDHEFMSAGVEFYQAEIQRKFSVIFVIQSSLQYLLPAQNAECSGLDVN